MRLLGFWATSSHYSPGLHQVEFTAASLLLVVVVWRARVSEPSPNMTVEFFFSFFSSSAGISIFANGDGVSDKVGREGRALGIEASVPLIHRDWVPWPTLLRNPIPIASCMPRLLLMFACQASRQSQAPQWRINQCPEQVKGGRRSYY